LNTRVVHLPVSRLLDPDLTASAKLLAIAVRLHPAADPAELEALTGLSRQTVLTGLRQAVVRNRAIKGPSVQVPHNLVSDRRVGAQGKVLYGLLQLTPGFRSQRGQFTYASLSALTRLGSNTLKRAMIDLTQAGWVQPSQKSRVSPIQFTLGTPEMRRCQEAVSRARKRLKRARFEGEAIMHEYLSLLIDSDQFTDNARPGFLINPLTHERLELDRFYPPRVAFEFHGTQHHEASEKFTQDQVKAQRVRDLIKAGLCFYQKIRLVVVYADDLSLQGMIHAIGQSMPLRDLAGHEQLIDELAEAGLIYQAKAKAKGWHPRENRADSFSPIT